MLKASKNYILTLEMPGTHTFYQWQLWEKREVTVIFL